MYSTILSTVHPKPNELFSGSDAGNMEFCRPEELLLPGDLGHSSCMQHVATAI